MAHLTALLRLLQVPKLGAQRIGRLLTEVDFNQFCQYDKAELRQIGWNDKQIHHWFHPNEAWIELAKNWQNLTAYQHILTLFDEDYPFLLRQISTAPPLLFVKGSIESLAKPQIAMVGSRDYSHYGEYWANYFCSALVKQGFTITSGLAVGIDGICHKQALREQGTTIAVLGSGLGHIYPSRHKGLAEQIVEQGGALLSEFLPNQPPIAENFPRRNRIISGLALGTLVVEATLNSGSLITARYALEQGREVFALPNEVQNPYSQGCHQLIKQGALLVDSVEDIVEAVALQRQPNLFTESEIEKPMAQKAVSFKLDFAKNDSNLTACQQKLVAQMSFEAISIDDLAKACELNVEEVLVELLNLELIGLVKSVSGGYIRA